MALGVLTALRTTWAQDIADLINAGSAGGKIKIYDGSQPATGGTATNLLATLTFSATCEASVTSGVLTFDTISSDTSADATATATWFRITDSDDTFVLDGTVGTSGADLNFDSTSIVTGGTVAISSWTITAPNA